MPTRRRSDSLPRRADAITEEIARRAYELFCARGCEHGHDVDDWLQAEKELLAAVTRLTRDDSPTTTDSNLRPADVAVR